VTPRGNSRDIGLSNWKFQEISIRVLAWKEKPREDSTNGSRNQTWGKTSDSRRAEEAYLVSSMVTGIEGGAEYQKGRRRLDVRRG